MFRLEDLLRSQWDVFLENGALVFHNCALQRREVEQLQHYIDQSGVPLKSIQFERCHLDARDEETIRLLRDFSGTNSLKNIVFNTPTLSNERVAEILDGCRDNIQQLLFTWSFARAATLNRDLVFGRLHQLHTLVLKYGGLEFFAEMDSDFSRTLPTLEKLEVLEFHGWTIRDVRFRELIESIRCMTSLRILHFEKIEGLTCASLASLGDLATVEDGINGVEELRFHRIRGMLANATNTEVESFLSFLHVKKLELQDCNLTRPVVRAILRGMGDPNICSLSMLSLHESAFGREEFEVLIEVLPRTTLRSLSIDQVAVSMQEYDWSGRFEAALSKNMTLTNLHFTDRMHQRLPRSREERIQRLMKRNQRGLFVNRVLKELSIMDQSTPFLLSHAFARLMVDDEATSDVQRLLTNRVSLMAD